MEHLLTKETYVYSMSAKNKPALCVESGEKIVVETYDCFLNQIESEKTAYHAIDWNQINPATGPVYVEGAAPGDILKVEIKKIELGQEGTMVTGPELGVLGNEITDFSIKKIQIENDMVAFNENIHFPLRPMIGVIGVAPHEGEVNCGTPGEHGGNMDTTLITEGATLYFPVFHEGALFSLGDVHASMGDGEVCVSGVEIPARVTVVLTVIKGQTIHTPVVENQDGFAFIVSKPTLDEAAEGAVKEMVHYLAKRSGLPVSDVTMLLSAAGDVQVSQIVDPLRTARMFVPKLIVHQLGIKEIF
ncbi:acetamidase/formamidase family protein [Weizmannia coagulans]|jgi:amidase|uniref:Acetamidase/Formamidase n=3 Tax=Heyndrickxia TaxID=2837504 RepID=G2TQT2_HEYCO|nr:MULTISPECIES: acetamidase/formamidase family protein [Heyndrickxia]AEO99930.1 Acetamidase/Formamidase [Heyndrickxia coagulans 36D1]AJO24246.1 acetamidase/Formamidase [Heyndrickxia coagulans]AKN54279.1 Acetamidase [Heyndrickxia coagulans]APB38346.1 acetamidase [Heyndrickxia coagulans]ATW84133.1 acetamidase [Heyndrickxia coagulans]